MNNRLCIVIILLLMSVAVSAQRPVLADSVLLVRSGGSVQLSLTVALAGTPLPRRDVVVLTPRLVGAKDSVDFPPIAVFGRNAYYRDVRHVNATLPATAHRIRYKRAPRTEHYTRTLGWQPWMSHSRLKIITTGGTPCEQQYLGSSDTTAFDDMPADTIITWPTVTQTETVTDTIRGEARIQFMVNKTDFNPALAANRTELEKVRSSIDSVRNNPDAGSPQYTIKGYASPEGPYANNVRLARGRTERLRQYISGQWGVPDSQLHTDSEPEDWQGMRQYVVAHRDDIADADAVLGIIDNDDADLDHKLDVLARHYPKAYRRLLRDCFPSLRRTEYTISYERRHRTEQQRRAQHPDTIIRPATTSDGQQELQPDIVTRMKPTRPWLAVKSNMLFDLLLTPNIELELPIGDRWSLMVEDWFPWLLHNKGGNISIGRYIEPGGEMKSSAYELWTVGAELRHWFTGCCPEARPRLTGPFVGAYYANGKYDVEWNSKGDQGEFQSVGLTAGYAWPLSRHWNIEASVSAGYFWGPRRHYEGEFGDTHLIWKYTGRTSYIGPTKLKLSIVWLIPTLSKQKGGAHE